MLVVVDAVDIGVEPHLASAERRVAVTLESYAVDRVACHELALCPTALDGHLGEVFFDDYLSQAGVGFKYYLYYLCLAIGVGSEVGYARPLLAARYVVFAVACHRRHVEAFYVVRTVLSVAVDHVVCGALVVLVVDLNPQYVLADKYLVCHLHHLELAVAEEDDDVVDVGTVAHELVFLQSGADKALLTVDVQLLVCLYHGGGYNGVEALYLGKSWVMFAIFVFDELEPVYRDVGHVGEIVVYVLQLSLDFVHQLVGLVLVELQYALHLYLHKTQYVVAGNVANEVFGKRRQLLVDERNRHVHVGGVFKSALLVDALFDEDALKRRKEQLFEQLATAYL